MTDEIESKFSLVIGGPFYRLQHRLGMLGPDMLPTMRAALILVIIAWLPLLLLAFALDSASSSNLDERALLLDYSVHARFLIAIFVFTLMERIADRRVSLLIKQFQSTGLVESAEDSNFARVLHIADQRSGSTLAETVLLGLAYAASLTGVITTLSVLDYSWLGSSVEGSRHLNFAGWWALLVSFPLFWFLLLRWLWRFMVWTVLLNDISSLNLRLVPTHSDRCGGIGFLSLFPSIFSPFVFALSCVTASAALLGITFDDMSLEYMGVMFIVWLLLVLIIFIGPLFVFRRPLARLKIDALLDLGVQATKHGLSDGSEKSDDQESHLANKYEMVQNMQPIPASRETFLPLIVATTVPWLIVVLTQVSFLELLTTVISALL